jgi:predicted acyl esterase
MNRAKPTVSYAREHDTMKSLPSQSKQLWLVLLCAAYFASPAVVFADQADGTGHAYSFSLIYRNVMIPMRDGVHLATEFYAPGEAGVKPASGHFPTLLR